MKLVCSQAELSASLQLVSRAVASRPTHPVLANVLPTADGGFIAAGAAYNPYNAGYPPGYSQDTWVVKVDSLGCIIPGCDAVGVQEVLTNFTDALRVWPNPVASGGSLSVQLELPAWFAPNGGLHLTLTNALGQVVQQETMATYTLTMQTGGLAPGLYHLHISDATRWISGTAVLVE